MCDWSHSKPQKESPILEPRKIKKFSLKLYLMKTHQLRMGHVLDVLEVYFRSKRLSSKVALKSFLLANYSLAGQFFSENVKMI